MFFADNIIYVLGTLNDLSGGYCDCIIYNENYPITYPFYFESYKPVDICYMPQLDAFFVLTGTTIQGVFITGNGIPEFSKISKDYPVTTNAVRIIRVGDKLITLGSKLTVYTVLKTILFLKKTILRYPVPAV